MGSGSSIAGLFASSASGAVSAGGASGAVAVVWPTWEAPAALGGGGVLGRRRDASQQVLALLADVLPVRDIDGVAAGRVHVIVLLAQPAVHGACFQRTSPALSPAPVLSAVRVPRREGSGRQLQFRLEGDGRCGRPARRMSAMVLGTFSKLTRRIALGQERAHKVRVGPEVLCSSLGRERWRLRLRLRLSCRGLSSCSERRGIGESPPFPGLPRLFRPRGLFFPGLS